MSAAVHLGEFVAGLRWNDVAPALQAKVKSHVLDTLGVICAGVDEAAAAAASVAMRRLGGTPESTVVARNWRLPAPHAAFLNTFAGRLHTFDDTHDAGPLHPGTTVVSAALACAEVSGASGSDFLAAVLTGYEVAVRVSAALGPAHYGAGFHNTGTCNVFGACAAAARVFGLDATATTGALGLAGEAAAGLRQYQVDGSMVDSSLNAARAAQMGVMSVELVRAGLSGPAGILDGPWGVCGVMSAQPDVKRLTHGLGSAYEFLATAIKPYPSCRFTHGPIEVLLELRRLHAFAPGAIASVEIATFRESISVSDKPDILSRFEAVLSHQYNAALALSDGRITLESFDAGRIADPSLLALAERVSVVFDADLQESYPAKWGHRVTARLKDGRRFTALSEHPPGGADAPLPWSHVAEKFDALAAPLLGTAAAERVVTLVATLQDMPDTRSLARALQQASTLA